MIKNFFQDPLFVFEMANNHMGSVEHGIRIIEELARVKSSFSFQFAIKFQFRNLDTFIHPNYKQRMDLKYIKRFSETRLTKEQFHHLKRAAEKHQFITICTPFDEASVEDVVEFKFDILKIASASFTDWPLLEKAVVTQLPIIASTSAATLDQMDNVVSFFKNRNKVFALMHCTGEYPTQADHLQLNQIDLLRQRYSPIPIGYSTHEEPSNMDSIMIAIAKGAIVFEKHVAVETPEFKKNEYSATPQQIQQWLTAAKRAYEICGVVGKRSTASQKELADLRQFKRGWFTTRAIAAGEKIDSASSFLAFPNAEGQVVANDLSKYVDYYATSAIAPLGPITFENVRSENRREQIQEIVGRVKEFLFESQTIVPEMASLEISHHYGLSRFDEVGCVLITVVNREYCKKLILLFPNQRHPEQHHKKKEETFVVVYGKMTICLDGVERPCKPGDVITVNRNMKHSFWTQSGAIFEEISSTHHQDDSYYTDEKINQNKSRKTVLAHWLNQ